MTDLLISLDDKGGRSLEEILQEEIPKDAYNRYLIAVTLVKATTKENFDSIVEYILKPEFSEELSVAVVLEVTKRDPSMCETKAFVTWARQFKSLQL
jgi:hypothetical protein